MKEEEEEETFIWFTILAGRKSRQHGAKIWEKLLAVSEMAEGTTYQEHL